MKKIITFIKLFLGILVISVLSACGNKTLSAQEILIQSEEAMKEIDSVELTVDSKGAPLYWIQVDAKEDLFYGTFENTPRELTYNQELMMAKEPDGSVIQKHEEIHKKFVHDLEFMLSPFDYLRVLDEEIINKFVVKTVNENEVTVAYNSDEYVEEANELSGDLIVLMKHSLEHLTTDTIHLDMDYDFEPLELTLTINQSTNLLRKFSIQIAPVDDLLTNAISLNLLMTYDHYNEDFDITMLKETAAPISETETTRTFELIQDGYHSKVILTAIDDIITKQNVRNVIDFHKTRLETPEEFKAAMDEEVEKYKSYDGASMSVEYRETEAIQTIDFDYEILALETSSTDERASMKETAERLFNLGYIEID